MPDKQIDSCDSANEEQEVRPYTEDIRFVFVPLRTILLIKIIPCHSRTHDEYGQHGEPDGGIEAYNELFHVHLAEMNALSLRLINSNRFTTSEFRRITNFAIV